MSSQVYNYNYTVVVLTDGRIDSDGWYVASSEALPTTFDPHHNLCTFRGWAGTVIIDSSHSEMIGCVGQEILDHEVNTRLLYNRLPFLEPLLKHLHLWGVVEWVWSIIDPPHT